MDQKRASQWYVQTEHYSANRCKYVTGGTTSPVEKSVCKKQK